MANELIVLHKENIVLPQPTVEPGSVSEDFSKVKEALAPRLNVLRNWEIKEEEFKDAKDIRADMNKQRKGCEALYKSIKEEFRQPFMAFEESYRETIRLFDEADLAMKCQIDQFDKKRRDERLSHAMEIYKEVFTDVSKEVREFADQCEWIVKGEWSNATYPMSKVKADCDSALNEILSAIQLLTGEYAEQMLEDFRINGSIAKAQLEGQRLQRAKEDMKGLASSNETKRYPTPSSFVKRDEDMRYGSMDLRFTGRLYQLKWLRDLCETEGITITNLRNNKEK